MRNNTQRVLGKMTEKVGCYKDSHAGLSSNDARSTFELSSHLSIVNLKKWIEIRKEYMK